jgi:ComF family protein
MITFKSITTSISQLFFPHHCAGCGSDLLPADQLICLHCYSDMPHTNYELHAANPVEKMFWGRLPVSAGMAAFYFSKTSVIQTLIHDLKYKGRQDIGVFLGREIGKRIAECYRFMEVDALVPLPLYKDKEYKRGYNQAKVLCDGMSEVLHLPVITNNLIRKRHTETQTKKGRVDRWQNVADSFVVQDPTALKGLHVLLVDDVITTGATMEACGSKIIEVPGCSLSIATLAIATH